MARWAWTPTNPPLVDMQATGRRLSRSWAIPLRTKDLGAAGKKILQIIRFAAAVCVAFGGLYGTVYCLIGEFQPVDMVQLVYLCLMGLLLVVHETPFGKFQILFDIREHIDKYFAILNRVTGKGITYIFLGTMTFVALWVNEASYVLNVLISLVILGAGGITTFQGVKTTILLNKARQNLKQGQDPSQFLHMAQQIVAQHGRTYNQQGLTDLELNLALNTQFTASDLRMIMAVIASDQKRSRVTAEDLAELLKVPALI